MDLTAELTAAAREAENQARLERIAAENRRVRCALDNVSNNVMIADNERRIIYMNATVREMFSSAAADIRKQLPKFDADKLIGASMDAFHQRPEHQAAMLTALKQTHRAEIRLGGHTFCLTVNPILDERGERQGTVVEWKDRTAEVATETEVMAAAQGAADGDFTRKITVEDKQGFFRQLAEAINRLLRTSQDIVLQMRNSADAISIASKEIASGNSDLSARTEQQAASLEETASSMEELTSTVKQNAENARQANQLAIGASDVARKGGEAVGEVIKTMDAISQSSRRIADIIGVIDGIAFQTNILALNAAVEAARAGEQGRGFAVVATEVRGLAQRSAAAAKEIKELIGDSAGKVAVGGKLVELAGSTMQEVVMSVKRVTDIMAEISAASAEQSNGIDQVNQAVMHMDEGTQQNAAMVEQITASAQSLQEQASGLVETVRRFRLDGQVPAVASAAPPPVASKSDELPRSRVVRPLRAESPKSNGAAKPAVRSAAAAEHWAEF
ncbi:MAG: methyl-accepting chemotaxis protein [Nevskia sp.]|nr:methyl-accepting chemotaxis protein [Nevskia sp.]